MLDTIRRIGCVLAAVACVAALVMTVAMTAKFGLFAEREPLSAVQTALRFVFVAAELVLLFVRRNSLERITLVACVFASGSAGLFGLGMRSHLLSAVRILAHIAAYALGAIVLMRFSRKREICENLRKSAANSSARICG